MSVQNVSYNKNNLIYVVSSCDYFPVVSTVTNLLAVAIFKVLVNPLMRRLARERFQKCDICQYFDQKPWKRIALAMVPIVGNAILLYCDSRSEKKRIQPQEKVLKLDVEPLPQLQPPSPIALSQECNNDLKAPEVDNRKLLTIKIPSWVEGERAKRIRALSKATEAFPVLTKEAIDAKQSAINDKYSKKYPNWVPIRFYWHDSFLLNHNGNHNLLRSLSSFMDRLSLVDEPLQEIGEAAFEFGCLQLWNKSPEFMKAKEFFEIGKKMGHWESILFLSVLRKVVPNLKEVAPKNVNARARPELHKVEREEMEKEKGGLLFSLGTEFEGCLPDEMIYAIFREAHERGHSQAAYIVGYKLYHGLGTAPDRARGHELMNQKNKDK